MTTANRTCTVCTGPWSIWWCSPTLPSTLWRLWTLENTISPSPLSPHSNTASHASSLADGVCVVCCRLVQFLFCFHLLQSCIIIVETWVYC
ncbi:hypothetical protein GBAR_LOCUS28876, partial [Geodia barretti]